MRKAIINYATEISNSFERNPGLCFAYEGRNFCADMYRIIETETQIPYLDLRTDHVDLYVRHMETITNRDYDYQLHDLPPVKEIKDGIHALVGRKFDTVGWSDGVVTINARFLYKTMEALKAKKCYVSSKKYSGIFFFEDDDPEAINKCMVLPVVDNGKRGFWVVEKKE